MWLCRAQESFLPAHTTETDSRHHRQRSVQCNGGRRLDVREQRRHYKQKQKDTITLVLYTMWARSMAGSLARSSRKFVFQKNHQLAITNTRSIKQRFSTSDSSSHHVETCAKSLSQASQQIASDQAAATELALRLSPEARRELAGLSFDTNKQVPEPSFIDLRLVALNQAIPFVGFGIMDNAILIIAGDAIDTSLGVLLGISTLCAAAIGNIISDVAGVMLGTVIEDFCARLGLPVPNISAAQRQLRSVRFAGQFGCALGIVVGCIIGMFPLLFLDAKKSQRLKQVSILEKEKRRGICLREEFSNYHMFL